MEKHKKYKKITQCIKCGHKSDLMGSPMIDRWIEFTENNTPAELIRRQCPTCHYQWYELPLDQEG